MVGLGLRSSILFVPQCFFELIERVECGLLAAQRCVF